MFESENAKEENSMEFYFEKNLKEVFRYKDFKKIKIYTDPIENNETTVITQLDILNSIADNINLNLANKKYYDIFFTASTGMGKSLLFQLPAIDLHKNDMLTVVITPLKALMKDQVASLKSMGIDFATFISSDNTFLEKEERLNGVREGRYSLVYISPEFLVKSGNIQNLLGVSEERRIGLYVVDEAHCISTWGKNFRPDYWYIGKKIKDWRKEKYLNAPILAMTATAVNGGDFDSVDEIIQILNLRISKPILSYVRRENIEIEIDEYDPSDGRYTDSKKQEFVANRIKQLSKSYRKILVYHPFKSQTEALKEKIEEKGIKASIFVGDMEKEERDEVFDLFKNNKIDCVVATKAFGMGVNIPDIDCVYHYAINKSLTDYVQEIGRAGRDPSINALALTDYHYKDLKFTRMLNGFSGLAQWQIKKILEKLLVIFKENHKDLKGGWIIVSPDSFSHIYRHSDDVENKTKTAFLLIEKDFENKFGFPLVSFSIPLKSNVYCAIESKDVNILKNSEYISCFEKERKSEDNYRLDRNSEKISDIGDIWKLDLEKLWEDFYKNENLASLRYKFFKGDELIKGIKLYPRIQIKANLTDSYSNIKAEIASFLDKFDEIFLSFGSKYFTKEDLDKKLKEYEIHKENLSEAIINFFKIDYDEDGIDYSKTYQFLFERKMGDQNFKKYSVYTNKFYGFRNFIMRNLKDTFNGTESYDRFISNSNEEILIFFGFLELLNFLNFQIIGGRNTAFNIYIGDPVRLERELQHNYRNLLLTKIKQREENEMKLIRAFVEEFTTSEKAWDFIEQYLLGKFRYEDLGGIQSEEDSDIEGEI